MPNQDLSVTKSSFEPISNSDIEVLILGSIPGDRSIELGEYYGHPRNRLWQVIAAITNNDLPQTYPDKKALLLNSKIGVWDVAKQANRLGSLDSAIKNEAPNDLETFLTKHENLQIIGFNGKKSEALFDKYFKRRNDFKYISLPSTSPANASINLEKLCECWSKLFNK